MSAPKLPNQLLAVAAAVATAVGAAGTATGGGGDGVVLSSSAMMMMLRSGVTESLCVWVQERKGIELKNHEM